MRDSSKQIRLLAGLLLTFLAIFAATPVMGAGTGSNNAYKAVFDANYYYNAYPDLQAAFGRNESKLFSHFVSYGIKEGRSGNSEFNIAVYKANNPDLVAVFGSDLRAYCNHYITYGRAEGRVASNGDAGQPAAVQETAGKEAAAVQQADTGNVISTCTTYYETGVPRAKNISVAVSRINGVIVAPGQEFSFSRTILPRSRANGYVEGPAYSSGKVIQSVGGGICQVSSTLYAAMVKGSVPASERHAHSMPVPYLPEGMDATIAGTSLDLKFVNNYDYSVMIEASANGGVLTVTLKRV